MRVSPSGKPVTRPSQMFGGDASVANVLESTGTTTPPEWRTPTTSPNIVFVDMSTKVSIGEQDGSIARPFTAIQPAINRARQLMTAAAMPGSALGFSCVIQIAMGNYAEDVTIPAPVYDPDIHTALECVYVLQSWSRAHPQTFALPTLSGIWSVEEAVDGASHYISPISFDHLMLYGTAKSSIAGGRLSIAMTSCVDIRNITGGDVEAKWQNSKVAISDITGTGSLIVETDDYSWGSGLNVTAMHSPSLRVAHYGSGIDVRYVQMGASGVSVGSSAIIELIWPGALVGDFSLWSTKSSASTADYILTFVGCEADRVYFRLTNISRASGDFLEDGFVSLFRRDLPGTYAP
jgi:hypothetical protein